MSAGELSGAVRARAEAWLAVDPDPGTRAELTALLDRPDELAQVFGSRLGFGTAGLRGPLGPGPSAMNRVLVRTTAAAVAEVLLARGEAGGPVVIGRDARHGSADFALDSARVFAARGLEARLLDGPVPTPVLAYAVRHEGAVAGVQVTASHNPPGDNGYKVYWGDGAQIVEPIDALVSAAMDRIGLLSEADLAAADDPAVVPLGPEVTNAYLDAVLAAAPARGSDEVRVAYTPLHGVGGATMLALWDRAGLPRPAVVPEQLDPDPDFPTVSFPNPEEPGAMDLVLALAGREGVDVALAHDPDADRLAAAVPDRRGGWRVLTGNELGALLADHLLRCTSGPGRVVATSVVSSTLLDRIAAEHGVRSERTLTGFKWIVRPALADPSARFVFGYEEALGYLVNDVVWDKDGLSAALVLTGLVADLGAGGRTLLDRLDELAVRHGLHATRSWSVRRSDGVEAVEALRAAPPVALAGAPVVAVEDRVAEAGLLTVRTGDAWLAVRPSGTEPKLKYYAEVVVPVAGDDVATARVEAEERLDAIEAEAGV